MPPARVCPSCRQLNAAHEARCFRCGRRLPSPTERRLLRGWSDLFGHEHPATRALVAVNALVFALMLLQVVVVTGSFPASALFSSLPGDVLLQWGALVVEPESARGSGLGAFTGPLRLVSAVFLHASVMHVVFNCLALQVFARQLEQGIGAARLVITFIVTGVAGYLATEFWGHLTGQLMSTVGMSGAVFGVAGATVGYMKAEKHPAWKHALAQLVGYIILMALVFGGVFSGVRADNSAHIGGLLAGLAMGGLLYREQRRRWARDKAALWVAVALSVLAVVSLVAAQLEWASVRAALFDSVNVGS